MIRLRTSVMPLVLLVAACGGGPRRPAGRATAPARPRPVAASEFPAVVPPSSPVTATAFTSFVDAYFDRYFAMQPTMATANGLHERDSELEDYSLPRVEARVAELHEQANRLAAIRTGPLSDSDEIDAEILGAQLKAELLEWTRVRSHRTNPMTYVSVGGNAIDLLMKRAFAPAPDRLRGVIERVRKFTALLPEGKANLENPPKEFTDLALRMAKGSVDYFAHDVRTWAHASAGDDAALRRDADKALDGLVAALKDFTTFLQKDLSKRSTGKYALGADLFSEKLRDEEMIEESIPDLLSKAEARLRKDQASFVETAKAIDPKKTPREVMGALEKDHPTAKRLLPEVASTLEKTRAFLVEKNLVSIPSEVRPKVIETPPFARAGVFAMMDTPGAYETKATEAFYYVTPPEKDWTAKHVEEHLRLFNVPVITDVTIHEVFPGHYLQFLYAPRYPTKTRKLVSVSSNSEGWAHYAEEMMLDQGFGGGDPKMRLAQLSEALLRDCRFVVGIKLHTEGWPVERGAKFFEENGYQEPANAYEEARRGAYNPTYLYYTYGKLEIQKLREDFRIERGGTLKDFHDAFVAQGSIPLPLVRRLLLSTR